MTIAAYKALETLFGDGRVRAIGVSNFMPHYLEQLLGRTDIVPAVNQIELHPFFTQPTVQAADAEKASSPRRGHRSVASPSTQALARISRRT
jgi:diketogulonate reductase-like aldo/keto reductase